MENGARNTAIGTYAAATLHTGDNNIYIGYLADTQDRASQDPSANNEIVIGANATGNGDNTATIGNSNIEGFYVGAGLGKLVEINNNTALGSSALASTTSGNQNTALGNLAGFNLATGNYNIYIGYGADTTVPSTNNEIVIGANTTGHGDYTATIGNTDIRGFYVGDGDGRLVEVNTDNTAVGYNALKDNSIGDNNTAVGTTALASVGACNQNTALGNLAGYNLTTGDDDIFIGYNAEPSIANADNEIVIGAYTVGNGDNTATIGNSNMKGFYVGSGDGKLVEVDGSNHEIVIGANAISHGSRTTTIGNNLTTDAYIHGHFHTNGSINTDGSINAVGHIHTDGNITHGGTITQTSDERVKRDIQPTALGLDFIDKLSPVRYRRVNPADYPEPLLDSKFKGDDPAPRPPDDDTAYDGLIAQEVEAAIKDLGVEWSGHDVDAATGKQGLQYGLLVVPLINAVKELKAKDDKLEKRIFDLENKK